MGAKLVVQVVQLIQQRSHKCRHGFARQAVHGPPDFLQVVLRHTCLKKQAHHCTLVSLVLGRLVPEVTKQDRANLHDPNQHSAPEHQELGLRRELDLILRWTRNVRRRKKDGRDGRFLEKGVRGGASGG